MGFLSSLMYKRGIVKAIVNLSNGPSLTMMHFSGENATIMNCTFDGSLIQEAIEQAYRDGEVWKEQLRTIQILAERLT
jgi:hypothetical protein